MKFTTQQIELATKTTRDAPEVITKLTLTESEIADDVVMASLMSGQSPRVRLQNRMRDDGIPKEMTLSWADFITPGRAPRVVKPMTREELLAAIKADPELLKQLMSKPIGNE